MSSEEASEMSTDHKPSVAVPAIALRRVDAAAALGISPSTFDKHVRHQLRCVRLASVVIYPVSELIAWVERAQDTESIDGTLRKRRR